MAWLESHQTLANHPKTLKLARLLNVPRVTAVGHLHFLWWWALDYAQDGNLSKFDELDVAVAADWQGEPAVFVEGLKRAGFLDESGDIHDWNEYAGRLVERRRADAERKRSARAKDVHRTSGGHPEDGARNTTVPNTTEPKPNQSRVEENVPREPEQSPPQAPERVKYSPLFETFWREWNTGVTKGRGEKLPAFTEWKRLGLDRPAAETLRVEVFEGMLRWKASGKWRDEGGRYVKHAERWLKARGWETDPPDDAAPRAGPSPPGSRSRGEDPHRFLAVTNPPSRSVEHDPR